MRVSTPNFIQAENSSCLESADDMNSIGCLLQTDALIQVDEKFNAGEILQASKTFNASELFQACKKIKTGEMLQTSKSFNASEMLWTGEVKRGNCLVHFTDNTNRLVADVNQLIVRVRQADEKEYNVPNLRSSDGNLDRTVITVGLMPLYPKNAGWKDVLFQWLWKGPPKPTIRLLLVNI